MLSYSVKLTKLQSKDQGQSNSEDTKCYVFVKGFMKDKWLHSDLYSAFETFGTIVSAKVSIDKFHISKGFGYVQFESAVQAEKAKEAVSYHLYLILHRCMVTDFQVEILSKSQGTSQSKDLLPLNWL